MKDPQRAWPPRSERDPRQRFRRPTCRANCSRRPSVRRRKKICLSQGCGSPSTIPQPPPLSVVYHATYHRTVHERAHHVDVGVGLRHEANAHRGQFSRKVARQSDRCQKIQAAIAFDERIGWDRVRRGSHAHSSRGVPEVGPALGFHDACDPGSHGVALACHDLPVGTIGLLGIDSRHLPCEQPHERPIGIAAAL